MSRKHCVIIYNDSDVLIRDLNSRNGTYVDGERIPAEVPRQLSHHNLLRIGKYTFRISIRDAETRRPHRPELIDMSTLSGPKVVLTEQTKGAAQLLSELDDLASKLDVRRADEEQSTPAKAVGDASKPAPKKRQEDAPEVADDSRDLTEFMNAGVGDDSDEQSTVMLSSADEDDGVDSTEDSSEGESQDTKAAKKPNKLPEHLRPKGPKNSQSAAADALKNLFVR